MDLAKETRAHDCEPCCLEPRCPAATPRQRKPLTPVFFVVVAGLWAVALSVAPAPAQTPSKDLWQTYMEAAEVSDQTDDFNVEAITLNAALALAKQRDPAGQRLMLSRLPLILAYIELARKDLYQPLIKQGLHLDVSSLDKQLDDYISTVDNYAQSYYDRWNDHQNDNPTEAFKQEGRLYGAKNSYRIEVALRTKLRPQNQVALADAMGTLAFVYRKGADFNCAQYVYGKAIQRYVDFQQTRDALTTAGGRFSVGNLTVPSAEQSMTGQAVSDNQIYKMLEAALTMTNLAYESLTPPSGGTTTNANPLADCDAYGPAEPAIGFDAQASRASDYLETLVGLTARLHEEWPAHPFFGLLDFCLAYLYGVEFKMAQRHPDRYPDALAKARKAYEESLAIMTHAQGPHWSSVRAAAVYYVDLLIEAKLPDEAKKIEEQYGVKPSGATN